MKEVEQFDTILEVEDHLKEVHSVDDPYRMFNLEWPSYKKDLDYIHEYVHEADEMEEQVYRHRSEGDG